MTFGERGVGGGGLDFLAKDLVLFKHVKTCLRRAVDPTEGEDVPPLLLAVDGLGSLLRSLARQHVC
jgi:hypothetical protein